MFFKCNHDDCEAIFTSKQSRNQHQRTHNDGEGIICQTCNQKFTQQQALLRHLRVHDKQKPYQCTVPGCGKYFTQSSNLTRHKKFHEGIKPFKCQECDKRFSSNGNLKQHLLTHLNKDAKVELRCPFPGCNSKASNHSNLKTHYREYHNNQFQNMVTSGIISNEAFPDRQREEIETAPDEADFQTVLQNGLALSSLPFENPLANQIVDGRRGRPARKIFNIIKLKKPFTETPYKRQKLVLDEEIIEKPILYKKCTAKNGPFKVEKVPR